MLLKGCLASPAVLEGAVVSFGRLTVVDIPASSSPLVPLCGAPENLLPVLRGPRGD